MTTAKIGMLTEVIDLRVYKINKDMVDKKETYNISNIKNAIIDLLGLIEMLGMTDIDTSILTNNFACLMSADTYDCDFKSLHKAAWQLCIEISKTYALELTDEPQAYRVFARIALYLKKSRILAN